MFTGFGNFLNLNKKEAVAINFKIMDLSKPVFIESISENFVVLFTDNGKPDHRMCWAGTLIPIYKASDGSYTYISKNSSDSEEDIEKARVFFDFSFVWRGVWEGRIYFKDDEYWHEDIAVIHDAWNQIEKILKDRIKSDNPNYGYFND